MNTMIEIMANQVCVATRLLLEYSRTITSLDSFSICNRELGVMVIRPEHCFINDLFPCDMSVVSLETGEVLENSRQPIADYKEHLSLYRQHEYMHAIMHSYSNEKMKYSIGLQNERETYQFGESGVIFEKDNGAFLWDRTPMKIYDLEVNLNNDLVLAEKLNLDKPRFFWRNDKKTNVPIGERDYYKGVPGTHVTFEESFRIHFNLLQYFDRVCRENGIHYSLTGGTLLGAVREGGFIAWDDDVDVFLTRPEYDKLLKCFPSNERYTLVNREIDPTFEHAFSRLMDNKTYIRVSPNIVSAGRGLHLDICVVDGLPKWKLLQYVHMKRMRFYFVFRGFTVREMKAIRSAKNPVVKLIVKLTKVFTNLEFWNKKIYKHMAKYKFDTSDFVGNFASSGYGRRERMHRSSFANYEDILFEGMRCMVCSGYKEYLTNIYGNYLNLPSKNKRVGHHLGEIYWVE